MLSSIYAKLACLALVLSFGLWCHHLGATSVQAKWDAAKEAQAHAVANAKANNAQQALDWTRQFAAANSTYQDTIHAPAPSIAGTVAADVAAGRLQLRDEPVCPGSGSAGQAAGRSGAVDVAAAAAATQRLADSIAAVQVGDAADARERQLSAQVVALQAVLRAERGH